LNLSKNMQFRFLKYQFFIATIILINSFCPAQSLVELYNHNRFSEFKKTLKKKPHLLRKTSKKDVAIISYLAGNKYPESFSYLEFILDSIPDPPLNDFDNKNLTPLVYACYTGSLSKVSLLVNHGAEINKKGHLGITALMCAGMNGNENIVEFLIKHGADVNAISENGITPLIFGLHVGQLNMLSLFLKNGVDLKYHDPDGNSILAYVCGKSVDGKLPVINYQIVDTILSLGLDINYPNSFQFTPFMYSVMMGDKGLIELLIQHGADVNSQENSGLTPLFIAVQNGYYSVVKLLLENKANPNIISFEGHSVKELAGKLGFSDIEQVLSFNNEMPSSSTNFDKSGK